MGFIFLGQNRPINYLHSFPFFLMYLYIIEYAGGYLTSHYLPNVWLYNYSSTIEICYYLWLVSRMYTLKKKSRIVLLIAMIYFWVSLINIVFFQGKKGFHTITFGLGSLILIGSIIYYFYQLLVFPKETQLTKQIEFWICTALLFSFVSGFPIFCLNNFYANELAESIWPTIDVISAIINIIFYSLFIVAFACKIQFRRKQIN